MDLKVMKNILKDYRTAHYNPKTKKIKSFYIRHYKYRNNIFHKLIHYHEKGHQYLDEKGYNEFLLIAVKITLWLTLIYPLLLGFEELFAWLYSLKKVFKK